ncbi:hypothetical protein PLEI_4279 [Photobacterium leiognathi lrivu.4.1]|uniref:Uncharacterized protein n=1 Tax=Photobacterium leiognathi lrivu.4.1 TaxID=1248232 RepID=V5F4M4_PHOLE|nr:hypothetical protein [Photobacterium leiognathi]GAD32600.1 hypothetical protein PLEI_4279 [Photobacterium leiognathi lrivu.4.1]
MAESDNRYSVDYHFSPSEAPSKQYTDLTSMLGDYPATDSVIVSATQYSGSLSRELSPRSFTFSSDFVHDIRHIIPALDYNIPLNTGDNVTLLNQTQVESQVSVLDSSLTIGYQWQSNDGSGWTNVGSVSQAYGDLNTQLAPLVAGEQYRLKLIATDNNQTSNGSTSDVTTEVQNNSVSYNIEFDDLAQPQEGVRQTVLAKLTNNTPPALFTDRNIRWQRVENDKTLTELSDKDSFIPTVDDVGKALQITVSYYGTTGNLLSQRSIQTQPVMKKSGSSTLDNLANRLTLTISPTLLAREASVSLNANDISAIGNETNITALYQWQRRDDNTDWTPINVNGNAVDYTTVQNDDNHYLRLQVILSTTDGSGNTMQLAPRYSNQTELIIPNSNGPIETLTLDFDVNTNTYTLTDRATMWLSKYQADNGVQVDKYQWYRLPAGGDIINNGEAITNANSDRYQLDSSDDVNFEHQLVVSLNNGVNVYSSRTNEWKNNNTDPNKTNEMDRYYDLVSISGNSTTAYVGQSLTAVFSGSTLQKDLMPPNVKYEWQTSSSGVDGTWSSVQGNDTASYLATSTGYVRVKGICLDNNGVAHKPDRYSQPLEIIAGSNSLLPWQVSLTQNSEYLVGQVISASHRSTTTESVNYEWFRLDTASGWGSATPLGINSSDYTIDEDDINHFIGVRATISNGIDPDITESAVSLNPVQKTNSGSVDSYTLTAQFTSTPLYQNSVLSYEWQLRKNGNIVTNPPGNISASWYLIDDPSQQSVRSLWQDVSGNTLTNNSASKYLLLSLEYTDTAALAKPFTRTIVSQEAIRNTIQPADVDLWYSVLKMSPQDPIDASSIPYWEAKEGSTESQSPNQGNTYRVEYQYSSDLQPSDWRVNLNDVFTNYPETKSVNVVAKQISQSDPDIERTFKVEFISTQDPAYLVRDITPVLLFDEPLNDNDTIGLTNQSKVLNDVQALRDNYPVTVKYQWQYFDPSSSSQWQPIGPELDDYNDLMSLTSGYQYRLCLLSENFDTNAKSKSGSNSTSVVQANSINYDVTFENLSQPQVGIKQRIETRLTSSMPPASFTKREILWYRINSDQSLTELANSDTYIPQQEDEAHELRIVVEYYDDVGLIVKSSIDTKPVSDSSGSNTLDDFANKLSLNITPVTLAIYSEVGLNDTDVTTINDTVIKNNIAVDYQWQRSLDAKTWTNIDGANDIRYITDNADENHYLRLQLTLADGSSQLNPLMSNQTEQVNVIPPDKLKVHIKMQNPVYLNTPLTADITFSKDGEILVSDDYVISKEWYVLNDPNDLNNPSSWLSTNSGVIDKYVLLHLVYKDGDSFISQYALSELPVQPDTKKVLMESWYSKLVLAPNKPLVLNSQTALISSSPLETNGLESGLFNIELEYFEATTPNQAYSSLQDLVTNVNSVSWIQAKATQTSLIDPSVYRVIYSDQYSFKQTFTDTFLPPDVNRNNAPIAIDDRFQVEPSTTITLSPLDNDYDSDEGDQITLVSATSKFGTIAIVDNKIQYTLPNSLPAEWYIEYIIADQHGASNKGLIKLESENIQTEKPQFEEISTINLKATGLFTRVEVFSPKATDINGVPIPVSLLDNTLLLRSGSHVIYWEAIDATRNTKQTVSQRVNITPYVEFIPASHVYEGTTAQIRVKLNGPAPSYPVIIPVIVSTESTSDSNDHSLSLSNTHEVVITSGTEGILEFDIYQDNIDEGDEKLHLIFANNVHTGPLSDITINISEDEQPISLNAYVYNSIGNTVSITTPSLSSELNIILDSNVTLSNGSDIIVDWHYSGPDIDKESLGQINNYEPLILPELNKVGRYDFTFTAYPLSSDQQPIIGKTSLRVIEEIKLSLDIDTDNDGRSDAEEGMGDFDNDMIPNYLDPIDDCELQTNMINSSVNLVFESSPGDCIILGQLSSKIGSSSPYINASELTEIIPEDTANPNYSSAKIFNLSIRNKSSISSSFVIPLLEPLSSGSTLRKYTDNNGWFDFDESETGSNLKYAFGELGNCPPPHSPLYQEEITVGGYCIEMTIKDGGIHDLDQVHDYNIDDPTYVYSSIPNLNIAPFNYVINYTTNDIPDAFDILINLCDYITVTDCQSLEVINIRSPFVTPEISSNNQSTLNLQLPSWYRSDQTLTFTVVLNGSVGTVDMNISYNALTPTTETDNSLTPNIETNDSEKNIKSGGLFSLGFIIYLILITQIRCINAQKRTYKQ